MFFKVFILKKLLINLCKTGKKREKLMIVIFKEIFSMRNSEKKFLINFKKPSFRKVCHMA